MTSLPRYRYALVGVGSRAQMYLDAIAGDHADRATLCAWSDPNPGRLDWSLERVPALRDPALGDPALGDPARGEPVRFDTADLARVIAAERIDRVIVTSPDFTHAEHIVTALDAGADVIVEKPLTTTEEGVRAIAEAVARSGRSVTVTFNYRYAPRNTALKQLLASGEIGDVTSVHFEWVLDTAHGADYFRRWHREKANSGGLLVHKSTHHFDLVNWWLNSLPTRVYASGGLRFYGAEAAAARGLGERPERGTTDSPLRDGFSLDLRRDDLLRGLYFEQESHDGYLRDRDVFDAGITIEDNLSLVVDYASGATMSYSLNAHSPWEGYTVSVNGTRGRAELTVVERGAVLLDAEGHAVVDPSARPGDVVDERSRPVGERLVLQKHFEQAREVDIPGGDGGHGGGDSLLLAEVFAGPTGDPLGRAATWTDGIRSVVVGLSGNRSLETGQAVRPSDLDLGPAGSELRGGTA